MTVTVEAQRAVERPASGEGPCEVCRATRSARTAAVGPHELRRCLGCGLRFIRKADPSQPIDDYYGEVDYADWARCYEAFKRREFQRILARLRRLGAGRALLDVGCAYGLFVRLAVEAGFDATGLEPSPAVASIAAAHGLADRIRIGTVASLGDWAEQFDVVTLLDVLEHLPDPRAALVSVRRRMAPHGWLVVRIPNGQGLIHRVARAACAWSGGRIRAPLEAIAQLDNPCLHLFFFDPRTLTRLLRETGFETLAVSQADFFDHRRTAARMRFTGRSARYAAWDHPLVSWSLGLLQRVGRWAALPDEIIVYARPVTERE